MSDRIAVMHRGRVEQVAPPRGLYETPATAFVASFIGNINLLAGRAAGGNAVECGEARLAASGAAPAGAAVAVALRPERVRLDPSGALDTVLPMTVAHVVYQGETVRYILKSDGGLELQAVELGEVRFATGARVRAGWTAADARMIPAASATSSTPQESTA
jgi:ABC-type Fe3+/spermidine/putrescine transport system ATPase subunit